MEQPINQKAVNVQSLNESRVGGGPRSSFKAMPTSPSKASFTGSVR